MKHIYKTLFLIGSLMLLGLFVMSSRYMNPSTGDELASFQPSVYKNLITYTKGDLFVFETEKPSPKKMDQFSEKSRQLLGNRLSVPSIRSNEVMERSKSDPTAFFEANISEGKLAFNKGMQNYLDKGGRELPSQENANKASLQFIQESGLAPENKEELIMMHSGGLRTSFAGSNETIDVLRTVTYGRLLDGVPVYGAGSKIIVQVGNKGEIVGATSRWKKVQETSKKRVGEVEMKSARDAEVEMKRRLLTEFGKGTKSKLENMALAYYDGAGSHIQPAYFFQVKVMLPQVNDAPPVRFDYMGIVPALANSPERIEVMDTPKEASLIKKLSSKPTLDIREKKSRDIE
ncbi:MAG: hypothetical protein R3E32_15730 [Chitinophagales bacterium]